MMLMENSTFLMTCFALHLMFTPQLNLSNWNVNHIIILTDDVIKQLVKNRDHKLQNF